MKKNGLNLFAAYLQSYSNTYGPVERLDAVLSDLRDLPGLTALALGTRPDCLDEAKLDLLAERSRDMGLTEVFLELGLQSCRDETLKHINRGHTAAQFADIAVKAADRGLTVVAHVIGGLPKPDGREELPELLETVAFVNDLPIGGIKFHNLFVVRGTRLARWYESGEYIPPAREEYMHWLSEALMHLDPKTVIHRLNGNPLEGELLAPSWAANLRRLHNEIRAHFRAHDVWQGKKNGAEAGIPEWFELNKGDALS